MKTIAKVVKRNWLNPLSSVDTGSIRTSIDVNSYDNGSETYLRCDAEIRDCHDKVVLNFDCHDIAEANRRLKKLEIMSNHIVLMRSRIIDYRDNLNKPDKTKSNVK